MRPPARQPTRLVSRRAGGGPPTRLSTRVGRGSPRWPDPRPPRRVGRRARPLRPRDQVRRPQSRKKPLPDLNPVPARPAHPPAPDGSIRASPDDEPARVPGRLRGGAVLGLAERQPGRIGRWAGPICLLAALGLPSSHWFDNARFDRGRRPGRKRVRRPIPRLCSRIGAASVSGGNGFGLARSTRAAALVAFGGLAVATTAWMRRRPRGRRRIGDRRSYLIVRSTLRADEASGRLAEIRTIAVVAEPLLLAAVTVLRPAWNAPVTARFRGGFLEPGIALAVRSGAVPFHVPAARLGHVAAPLAPALLLVWIPGRRWAPGDQLERDDVRDPQRLAECRGGVVQTVAVATLVLGSLAALVHDELEEVAPTRSWPIRASCCSPWPRAVTPRPNLPACGSSSSSPQTALVAWAAATSRAFATSHLGRLRGWLRRTPLLGLTLVSLPRHSRLAWRRPFTRRGHPSPAGPPRSAAVLFVVTMILSIACYGRLLGVGLLAPTDDVSTARSERPHWSAVRPIRRGPRGHARHISDLSQDPRRRRRRGRTGRTAGRGCGCRAESGLLHEAAPLSSGRAGAADSVDNSCGTAHESRPIAPPSLLRRRFPAPDQYRQTHPPARLAFADAWQLPGAPIEPWKRAGQTQGRPRSGPDDHHQLVSRVRLARQV